MSPPPKYMLFKYNVFQFFFVFLLTTHTYRVEIMLRWQISNSIFVTRTQTLNFWSRILSIITDSFCLLKDFILFFKTAVNIIWTRFWGSKPKLRNILENIWPVIFMKDQGRLRNSSWSRDYGDMTIKCNMRSWTGSFIIQVALRRILWNNWYTWNMTYRIGSSIIWC